MAVLFVALAAGLTAGFLTGGRPSNISRRAIRGTAVLAGAVVFQLVPWIVDASPNTGLVCVIASYVLLAAFALINIRLVGMPIVLVGLLLNFTVIAVNSGMPVRADAMYTVDRNPGTLEDTAKRHLEGPDDRFAFLGDVVPIKPFHEVVSFGDLILAVGLANLMFRLMHPGPTLVRRHDEEHDSGLRANFDLPDHVLT
jgi:hypothetical protein